VRALSLLTIGLILFALTPAQPHPLYIENRVERALRDLSPSSAEAVIGTIAVVLPDESQRGFGGVLWFLGALIPLTLGAGLIRPGLNSLMVKTAGTGESGAVLGVSASVVSLADAVAPLIGGLVFQSLGASAPFALGAGLMLALLIIAWRLVH